jgi:hypothetical protein
MTSTDNHTLQPKGPALSTVLASGTTWERTLVPIGAAARAALFSLTALMLLVTVGQYFVGRRPSLSGPPGFYLFGWPWMERLIFDLASLAPLYIILTATQLASCALTEGFSMAGRRMQIGLGVLAVLSGVALLPVLGALLITAANLVAWLALASLVIGLIVALIGAALSS